MTRGRDTELCVGLLLPDVLGTYSDRGNAVVLAQRARWRGIPVEVLEVPLASAPPTSCDVYVLGGGEDAAQQLAAHWLAERPALRQALGRAQVVAVCAGLQLLGTRLTDADGRSSTGAGVLDLTTDPGRQRAVGEVVVDAGADGGGLLTGFENHLGRTRLGPGLQPLGRVLRGTGNGDGGDGVLTGTVVGTYLHGPVLARNPRLADLVLRRALGTAELPLLQVPDEEEARRLRLGRTHGTPARLAASVRRALRPDDRPGPARSPEDRPAGAEPAGAPRHVVESIEGARGDSGTSTEAMRWVPPDSPHRLRPTGA